MSKIGDAIEAWTAREFPEREKRLSISVVPGSTVVARIGGENKEFTGKNRLSLMAAWIMERIDAAVPGDEEQTPR